MSKHIIDNQPIMWTDAEYREAFQSLYEDEAEEIVREKIDLSEDERVEIEEVMEEYN